MNAATFENRWWIYQRERFPVFSHGALIAAFSVSAVCVSALLRGERSGPSAASALAAFAVSFLFFALLRIADEFKDAEQDARWRPYRPVPRGLVKLEELARLAAAMLLLQLAVAALLGPLMVLALLAAWAYFGLMVREFFIAEWLTRRPLLYMASHMVIVPLVAFCAAAADWGSAAPASIPGGMGWFLLASLGNGFVIELGRKIRAPHEEEPGVVTYSAAWGRFKAVAAWLAALAFTAPCALMTALRLGTGALTAIVCGALFGAALSIAWRFLFASEPQTGKWFEHASAVWMLSLNLALGVAPLAFSR